MNERYFPGLPKEVAAEYQYSKCAETMRLIEADMKDGYYVWRDECILENLKPVQSYYITLAKVRINANRRNGRKMQIKRSHPL